MFKKNILLLYFLLLPFTNLHSQFWGQEWHQLKSDPFFVYYLENDIASAKSILNVLERVYPRMSHEIGCEIQESISVFLCNSREVYRYIVGKNFPKWSTGVALPSSNFVVMQTFPTGTDPIKIAVHELTHILLDNAVHQKPIPRWFNEGLAVFYSDEKEFASSSLISKALLTNSIIPLTDIDEVLSFHTSKAQLAYQESYLAVIFLIEKYGMEVIKKVVSALAAEETNDQAFLTSIGMDLWDFELEWYKYIKKKHRWHFLVDFESYLWIFVLLLFVAGFIIIRRRNRKTIERWEHEEETQI